MLKILDSFQPEEARLFNLSNTEISLVSTY